MINFTIIFNDMIILNDMIMFNVILILNGVHIDITSYYHQLQWKVFFNKLLFKVPNKYLITKTIRELGLGTTTFALTYLHIL